MRAAPYAGAMSNQDRWSATWSDRLRRRSLPDAAETLLTLLVLVMLARGFPDDTSAHASPLALVQGLLVAAAGLAVTRRRYPVAFLVVGVACWLLATEPSAAALAFYNLGVCPLSPRRTTALAAAALAAMVSRFLLPDRLHMLWVSTAVLHMVAFGALPLAVGLWLSARRALLANLREQLDRARQVRETEVAAARTAERSRIAGEMHDVVAHRVSLMVLHAGALEVSTADRAVTGPAALIRENGREALQELRSVLGLLHAREDTVLAPQPTLERLDDLVRSSRQAGVKIRLDIEDVPQELPATVERTAYRIVQEALTNIHKHAPGARATIRLRHTADALDVAVRNSRPTRGPGEDFPHSGHGLLGLAERVQLLGGTLSAGTEKDGGFPPHRHPADHWPLRNSRPSGSAAVGPPSRSVIKT